MTTYSIRHIDSSAPPTEAHNGWERAQRASMRGAIDCSKSRLLVAPPARRDGVAAMLVALGNAGIEVTGVVAHDDSGTYILKVTDSPERAARILEGIGCRMHGATRSQPYLATPSMSTGGI